MIPAWVLPWVGLPYADKGRGPLAYDCWGLVRAVLAREAAIPLPDYADAYSGACNRLSVAGAIEAGLADGWCVVTRPQAFDLLILRIAGRPWHCAVMVTSGMFLHAPPLNTSCIERVDSPQWAKRIEGVYRHA